MDRLIKACCGGLAAGALTAAAQAAPPCSRTVTADVVALDQAMMINRLGASRPGGMVYALRGDVVPVKGQTGLQPGKVTLREGKRPRPMVLRVNAGDCLTIAFENLLAQDVVDKLQPVTRSASIHVAGLQLVARISDDGIAAGANPGPPVGKGQALVGPGQRTTYRLYAPQEGTFLLYSSAGDYNGFGTDQLTMGLFGSVNVEPKGAQWYRSQVTEADLRLATRGTVKGGYPLIDYEARYPRGHARSGMPVLRMLDDANRIVHSDLTAVITGPDHGRFSAPVAQPLNPALPDPGAPYREVTVMYHESQDVVQAFPWFYQVAHASTPTLNAGSDSFAINYGAAGIGAEIVANRMKIGPSANCPECKFEEFFLSSWVGGDPAMVLDVPANANCTPQLLEQYAARNNPDAPPPCVPGTGARPRLAKFADDPSNVYHTYQGDRARFRILHAGAAVHHVHHHHAHQWLQTPGSDLSSYLDSQAIGPGAAYTLDLVYNGSGNRNLTAGDSIFHCHFYPHFASGMWALFRVHDVLETGTPLEADGVVKSGVRALPDPEIMAGTPIPAVVPLPTRPMAPLPSPVSIKNGQPQLAGGGNPGYPFFVPGVAGHRPPHPPMDFAVDNGEVLDGGLPRHLIASADVSEQVQSATDFTKNLGAIDAYELPEHGTAAERAAMDAHAQASIATVQPDGSPGQFKMTGLPPAPGAPFANPGQGVDGKVRRYKGVNLQVNTVLNKKGWHYPQQRMMALWDDVRPILDGTKAPEPLFFRAHSNDVVEYWHTNLVPAYYELDDFQVRTPTDIIGQHIHLVKFDVLASDGAANGFNYEDGTFSAEEVRDRIDGINQKKGLRAYDGTGRRLLTAKPIAALGRGPVPGNDQWLGAQATVQRWWVDPLLDRSGTDRTYMTVFTHDHFGPSTHQMAGLYGGLLIEPAGSRWAMPDGTPLNTRPDGGPTSYAANITTPDGKGSYREFALAWGDLQLVYGPASRARPDCYPGQTPQWNNCTPVGPGQTYTGWSDPSHAINCPTCTNPTTFAPQAGSGLPTLIADFGNGVMSLNYRAEPLPLRAAGAPRIEANDLAHVFRSIPRSDPAMSEQPVGGKQVDPVCTGPACLRFPRGPIGAGMQPGDPFTPLLRAYPDDPVQLRMLVGAHTSMHEFSMHGLKWQHAPSDPNSGFRASQFMILSEHFEALLTVPRAGDYLYNPSASFEGLSTGVWGLLRAYGDQQAGLAALPNNAKPSQSPATLTVPAGMSTDCRSGQPCVRQFNVSALTIGQLVPNGALIYNARGAYLAPGRFDGATPLNDPNAIVYVLDEDLDPVTGWLKAGRTPEPLVLRAAAGDYIQVRLSNRMRGNETVFATADSGARPASTTPYTNPFQPVTLYPSASVGLHAQLLAYDINSSNGINLGNNPVQTVSPSDRPCGASRYPCRDYLWYAGSIERDANGAMVTTPVEFGAINLQPADPLLQAYHGLFGALVIEPLGATWIDDPGTRVSATVFGADGHAFRDFALIFQNDVAMLLGANSMYASGNSLSAFNYRSEPFFLRYGPRSNPGISPPPTNWAALSPSDLSNINGMSFSDFDTSASVSNSLVGGDPVTPVFRAPAGMPVRFRVLHAAGIGDNQQVFELSGHQWQEAPYQAKSTRIGHNPASDVTGTISGVGPTSHFDILIPEAGGRLRVAGDYLYRSSTAAQYQVGLWGLFRVAPGRSGDTMPDTVAITSASNARAGYTVSGTVTVRPARAASERVFAREVEVRGGGAVGRATVTPLGQWSYRGKGPMPSMLLVRSPFGGEASYGTPHVATVAGARVAPSLLRLPGRAKRAAIRP